MKVVLALGSLGIGGTESYSLTVAEQLDRLGHEVSIYTPQPGAGVAVARDRGIAVQGPGELPAEIDAAFVQDAAVAYEIAELRPQARRVFVTHSESFDPQSPPQLTGVVEAAVALNERVARRLRAFAGELPVVRLRQPIDNERFLPYGALPPRPREALVISNNNLAERRPLLEAAAGEAGLSLSWLGGEAGQTPDPRERIASAQIVIGYGRSLLEAMSCGRAAFVYDWAGGEGWVTAESYPRIEADGFAGRDEVVLSGEEMAAALAAYDPAMGPVNRDLVVAHHRANVHAQELLDLLGEVSPRDPADAPLAEMGRLVRLEWRARSEAHGLRTENAHLHREVGEIGQLNNQLRDELGLAQQETVRTEERFRGTFSWRVTAPLRAFTGLLRRLLRRG
jgi:hypothetical protein